MTPRVVALHGFLGRPADWDVLREAMPAVDLQAVDLWQWLDESGADGWEEAGRALDGLLATRLANEARGRTAEGRPRPVVVLAYSFGARLVLASSAVARGRAGIAGACLVSCNPGLPESDVEGRVARRKSDEEWARLLLQAADGDIWRAWDAQPVLAPPGGTDSDPRAPAPRRAGLPAPRARLARAMRTYSLAAQPDFRPSLREWGAPLLWVTGEADSKFCALADGLARDGVPATFARCAGAGHRVPWDNPGEFSRIFTSWLTGPGFHETTDHVDHDQRV